MLLGAVPQTPRIEVERDHAIGEQVQGHADFYRKLWASGDAGAVVMLDVLKGTEVKQLGVKSIDRNSYLRPRPTY